MTWELFCAKADMAQAQGDLVRPCMGKAFCLHRLLAFIEKKNHCKFISAQSFVILGQRTKNFYLRLFFFNASSLYKNGEELPPRFSP